MKNNTVLGKILRFVAIVLLGMNSAFHLLGGIGTTCVAIGAEKYDSMVGIVPFKWLYLIFVAVTLVLGVVGVRATVRLAKARKDSFRHALVILVVSLLVSGVHMLTSELLRGSSAPTNMRVYVNTFTLVFFLVMLIPGIRSKVRFEAEGNEMEQSTAAGAAIVLGGILTLTVHLWAGPTHTWNGINFADVWHGQLTLIGWAAIIIGLSLAFSNILAPLFSAEKKAELG